MHKPMMVASGRVVQARRGARMLLALTWLAVASAAEPCAAGDVEEKGPDGKVAVRYQTDADNKKNGTYEELFPDGKPRVKGAYTAGAKSGAWITRDEQGQTVESEGYRADKLEGPFVRYFPGSTRPMLKAAYKAGDFAGPVTVYSENGKLLRQAVYPRPRSAVEKAWATLAVPSPKEPAYKAEPSLQPPYKAGALAPETLDEGLRTAKLYRCLSGLPYLNLTTDPKLNDLAQHGSVVLVKIGSLTHTPSKPDDMDDAFFKLAYAGCNQSNLHSGQGTVVDAVHGFMNDSDPSNVQRVGHRTWILQPGLQKIGFGMSKGFTAMHVLDGSRKGPDYTDRE